MTRLRKDLERLVVEVRACRLCAHVLPLGPRPVLRASATARVCIVGQAPGTKVHESGIPWNDRSGDRLREWLALDRERFYDVSQIAIMPMGFCYPGRDSHGGDLPPRPECAPAWHARLLALMPKVELMLLVGSYAQAHYLGARRGVTMTETVASWKDVTGKNPGLRYFPLPHPSWRNTAWLKANPGSRLIFYPIYKHKFMHSWSGFDIRAPPSRRTAKRMSNPKLHEIQ